jgi:hypothetical protein
VTSVPPPKPWTPAPQPVTTLPPTSAVQLLPSEPQKLPVLQPGGPHFGQPLDLGVEYAVGAVVVGRSSAAVPITVTSNLKIASAVKSIKVDTQFIVLNDGCTGRQLAPGGSCTFDVVFRPTAIGPAETHIRLAMSHFCANAAGICAAPSSDVQQAKNFTRRTIPGTKIVVIEWSTNLKGPKGTVTLLGTGTGR